LFWLYKPYWCCSGVWAQLSRFQLKM
jgi:hypothetical protein